MSEFVGERARPCSQSSARPANARMACKRGLVALRACHRSLASGCELCVHERSAFALLICTAWNEPAHGVQVKSKAEEQHRLQRKPHKSLTARQHSVSRHGREASGCLHCHTSCSSPSNVQSNLDTQQLPICPVLFTNVPSGSAARTLGSRRWPKPAGMASKARMAGSTC